MSPPAAIELSDVTYHYGAHRALDGVRLSIPRGEIFALLGPNGGGKTTLFRLITTLVPVQQGTVRVMGCDASRQPAEIRRHIGVVFQGSSIDKKLTARENLRHRGHLYGLSGGPLRRRRDEMLERLGIAHRADERTEKLSGGLRRRVELAAAMMHGPQLLLLDEPTSGLDPAVRSDLWKYFDLLRRDAGVTIVVLTHLLDEADKADRLGILDRGQLVALDAPERLRDAVGGDMITVETDEPDALAEAIRAQLGCDAQAIDGAVRLEHRDGHRLVPQLVEAFGDRLRSVRVGKPTLEDVFIAHTGHRFFAAEEEVSVG